MRSESKELNIFTTYAPVKHTLHKGKHSLISFLNGIKKPLILQNCHCHAKRGKHSKTTTPKFKTSYKYKVLAADATISRYKESLFLCEMVNAQEGFVP